MWGKGDLRAILAGGGFRRLLWVRLTSQLADGWFQAGLAGSILFNPDRRTGSLAIAAGFAVLLLPYSLLGPYVGVFLDRWSRRNVLVGANLVRACLVLPTAALIFSGEELLFVLLALLVIGVNRFLLAGLSAALPHVVEEPRLVTANALATTLGTVVYSLGLGSAVLAQQLIGASSRSYGAIAAAAIVGYLVSSLVARSSFAPPDLGPDERVRIGGNFAVEIGQVARGMVAGGRHLAARRGAGYVMLAQAAHRMLYGVLAIATLLLYRNYFASGTNFSSSLVGLAEVVLAGSAGALLSAFITPLVTRRIGGRAWVASLIATVAVVVAVFGLPYRAGLLVVAVFFINIASQGMKIVVDTAIQRECDDEFRGRVFSVNDTAFNLCYVVGLFAGALALPETGKSVPVLSVVVGCYALLAVAYWVAAGRWARRVGHDIAPARTPEGVVW